MELSTKEQRLLTEFLGECYHEVGEATGYEHHRNRCLKCRTPLMIIPFSGREVIHLDFSDWRVVGRLVEKMSSRLRLLPLEKDRGWIAFYGQNEGGIGVTPQLAICRAVLAYLKEKE